MADERPRRLQRQTVVAVLREQIVQRADQVWGGVHQGAVEVEGDDGAGEIVFRGGQGVSPVDRPRRFG